MGVRIIDQHPPPVNADTPDRSGSQIRRAPERALIWERAGNARVLYSAARTAIFRGCAAHARPHRQPIEPAAAARRSPRCRPPARKCWRAAGRELDVLIVTGDAYVDHPSFGAAMIARVLEAEGLRVGVVAQPDWRTPASLQAMGRPRLFCGVTAGNLDSMLANYTAARHKRREDDYSEGGAAGPAPEPRGGGLRPAGASARSPGCRSCSAASRPACGGWRTTTTGRTSCGRPSSSTPRRTCSCTAWARARFARSPAG